MVVSAFCLSEFPNVSSRMQAVNTMWSNCSDTLVLIDRGTPIGFEVISNARQQILDIVSKAGQCAYILAPCAHELKCPLIGVAGRWCSAPQKVHLSPIVRSIRGNKYNHEDIKFSYVVIKRGKRPPAEAANYWPRIVFPPLKRNKHIILDTCTKAGSIDRVIIGKSSPAPQYYHARKSYWADLWPHDRDPSKKAVHKL